MGDIFDAGDFLGGRPIRGETLQVKNLLGGEGDIAGSVGLGKSVCRYGEDHPHTSSS